MTDNKKIRFLDLSVRNISERQDFLEALNSCLDHGQLVMGKEINNLEESLSNYVGRKKCISVSSGTDAVYLSLRALGIGPGDEVITTPLSWIATTNAIYMVGATPVFCDIQDDLNIDPETIQKVITSSTKAVISVDYTGNMANYAALNSVIDLYGLKLIEDGSQAFGASFNGKKCGSYGHIAAISHNPMKIFGGLGECGSVFTDDYEIAEKLNILRYNGMVNKEYLEYPSLNFRADALQASFLVKRLKRLSSKLQRRKEIAQIYNDSLYRSCKVPTETPNSERVFYTYTIQTNKRDSLSRYLTDNGIENKIQHPLLMSEQKPYKDCKAYTPRATEIVKKIICLPMHESLEAEEIEYVIKKVKDHLE